MNQEYAKIPLWPPTKMEWNPKQFCFNYFQMLLSQMIRERLACGFILLSAEYDVRAGLISNELVEIISVDKKRKVEAIDEKKSVKLVVILAPNRSKSVKTKKKSVL